MAPDFCYPALYVDGLHPVGAGEAGVDAPQGDRHVGDHLVFYHPGNPLQVLVGGGPHTPPSRLVVLAGDDEVMAFAARRLDGGYADPADGKLFGDIQLQRPRFHFVEALADDPDGFEYFFGPDHYATPYVAGVVGDYVEFDPVVSGIGMVAPTVYVYSRGPRYRTYESHVFAVLFVGNAYVSCPLLDVSVFYDGGDDRMPFALEFVEKLPELGPDFRGDVPAHSTHLAEPVGLTVAGDLFRHPHDRLTDTPALHEEGVEADQVTGKPYPQKVAVETLDFEHDGADVFGPRRRLDGGGVFYRLDVGDAVDAAADAADPFGHHRYVVVGKDGLGKLFDAAVNHEAAIFTTAHYFSLYVEAEVGRFVKGGMKRTEGDNGTPRRGLAEFEFAVFVVVFGDVVPVHVFA